MLDTINTILFWICLWLLLWNGYYLLFNKGIPNIRTAPAIRRRIIRLLREDAAARGIAAYRVVDLGSGNGLFTRQIARAMPQARVTGIEISALAFRWAGIFRHMSGLKNLEYRRSDFFAYDLSQADAVVMYLTSYQMEEIGKKLHRELRPGTLVTSNRFRLGDGWAPAQSIRVFTLYPHQRTVNVYRQA